MHVFCAIANSLAWHSKNIKIIYPYTTSQPLSSGFVLVHGVWKSKVHSLPNDDKNKSDK